MAATSAQEPRPLEINRHGDHDILIRWNTGEEGDLSGTIPAWPVPVRYVCR